MTPTKKTQTIPTAFEPQVVPWWRYPIVWMVIGGPLAVVIAGISTAVIAYRHIDPVLDTTVIPHASLQPALRGRNLAADHAMQSADIKSGDHK